MMLSEGETISPPQLMSWAWVDKNWLNLKISGLVQWEKYNMKSSTGRAPWQTFTASQEKRHAFNSPQRGDSIAAPRKSWKRKRKKTSVWTVKQKQQGICLHSLHVDFKYSNSFICCLKKSTSTEISFRTIIVCNGNVQTNVVFLRT